MIFQAYFTHLSRLKKIRLCRKSPGIQPQYGFALTILLKWGASSLWSSSLPAEFSMQNSDEMIIEKTNPTLFIKLGRTCVRDHTDELMYSLNVFP